MALSKSSEKPLKYLQWLTIFFNLRRNRNKPSLCLCIQPVNAKCHICFVFWVSERETKVDFFFLIEKTYPILTWCSISLGLGIREATSYGCGDVPI